MHKRFGPSYYRTKIIITRELVNKSWKQNFILLTVISKHVNYITLELSAGCAVLRISL